MRSFVRSVFAKRIPHRYAYRREDIARLGFDKSPYRSEDSGFDQIGVDLVHMVGDSLCKLVYAQEVP
eukprot:9314611-Pyramimonas_sp.AAC.1